MVAGSSLKQVIALEIYVRRKALVSASRPLAVWLLCASLDSMRIELGVVAGS